MATTKKYKIGIFIGISLVAIIVVTTVVLAVMLYYLNKELNRFTCLKPNNENGNNQSLKGIGGGIHKPRLLRGGGQPKYHHLSSVHFIT